MRTGLIIITIFALVALVAVGRLVDAPSNGAISSDDQVTQAVPDRLSSGVSISAGIPMSAPLTVTSGTGATSTAVTGCFDASSTGAWTVIDGTGTAVHLCAQPTTSSTNQVWQVR